MSEEAPFNKVELGLMRQAKRTMMILARIIRDKDPKKVVTDPDLKELIGERTLAEALAHEEIGKTIRERVTPDLPELNVEQETLVICQLGSTIFERLLDAESNEDNP
jgi:hypothetical protein